MRVTLETPLGALPGILTVFCVIGPNPPNSIISNGDRSEGATLSVPGIINFNHSAGGGQHIMPPSGGELSGPPGSGTICLQASTLQVRPVLPLACTSCPV